MAVIDVPGFVAAVKDHAAEHGFHIHDERHFVETYSLRQSWEVDLHPEEGCGGPVDLHLALDVDPRVMLAFEDEVMETEEGSPPPEGYYFPVTFTWSLGSLSNPPDLLRLAIDLAGIGGIEFPLEVSATDTFPSPTDAPERRVTVSCHLKVSLARIMEGEEVLCEPFEKARKVSEFLLEHAPTWMQAR